MTVEIPDTTANRISVKRADPHTNPDDAGTVDAKVREFWTENPDGRIDTRVKRSGTGWRSKATVWINADDEKPASTGHAYRELGQDDAPYGLYPAETSETVAVGRALRFLSFKGDTP